MRVLISDYKEQMEDNYQLTVDSIHEIMPEAEVCVEAFGTEDFYRKLQTADGLITAFVPVDDALLRKAENLKCISQNAVGYSNVSLDSVKKKGVALCHIEEYCSREVAEHAICLMLALNHNLSRYAYEIRERCVWDYKSASPRRTLNHQTVAIFGLGKIGRVTAELARELGMKVLAVDPFVSCEDMEKLGVIKTEKEQAFAEADVIINHMSLTKDNYHYFDEAAFESMKRNPIFINVGRGGCVHEEALEKALELGLVSGAGLDVLESENVDVANCNLAKRPDVILTPHSAFYSIDSVKRLHTISGRNLALYLSGQKEKIKGLVFDPWEDRF